MKKKKRFFTVITILIILVAVVLLTQKDNFIRAYVARNNAELESYALTMLEKGVVQTDNYGPFRTDIFPEDGLVEFSTGGWGLVPNTTYKGFYYSADNSHKPFGGADAEMTIDGDKATWTDGTDNHGSSQRITDKWFWYKASF